MAIRCNLDHGFPCWIRVHTRIQPNHGRVNYLHELHFRECYRIILKRNKIYTSSNTTILCFINLTLRLLMSYIFIYIYMERIFLMFLDHTQRRTIVGRTPLDERSPRRRDLYLTRHDTHNRQISMPPVGFEPTISADERPQAVAC